jgi:hypothetical protein
VLGGLQLGAVGGLEHETDAVGHGGSKFRAD